MLFCNPKVTLVPTHVGFEPALSIVLPGVGIPAQGAWVTQLMSAAHPAAVTLPSEVKLNVNAPLGSEEVTIPGLVEP